jgi:hypothetical protein
MRVKAWLRARRWYRIAQETRLGALRRLVRAKVVSHAG